MATQHAWFGRLLDWQWDPKRQMHTAYHGGRSHYITKVDRQTADAQGWRDDSGLASVERQLGRRA